MHTSLRHLLLAAFVISAGSASAHDSPCHFHGKKPASENTVKACADQRKAALLKAGKIDASWQALAPASVVLGPGPKGEEWRVIYENPQLDDAAKRRLFMFFTPQGNFVAANHSGQ
jgi:hypothetical protein